MQRIVYSYVFSMIIKFDIKYEPCKVTVKFESKKVDAFMLLTMSHGLASCMMERPARNRVEFLIIQKAL